MLRYAATLAAHCSALPILFSLLLLAWYTIEKAKAPKSTKRMCLCGRTDLGTVIGLLAKYYVNIDGTDAGDVVEDVWCDAVGKAKEKQQQIFSLNTDKGHHQ